MRVLRDVAELDGVWPEIYAAASVSDDDLRRVFSSFRLDLGYDLPPYPLGREYFDFQMRLYERVSGRKYDTTNEVSTFDVAEAVRRPFPFSTGSLSTTGQHLGALGFFLSSLTLPRGARILEYGPGWGNTTMALAQLGYRVTAVDIEPNFCELIRRRSALLGVDVEVIQGNFFHCETTADKYDAVVFYECFHHCADHLRLLRSLHRVMSRNGRVYLGGEPINDAFPIPWGLRLDGESLWAIRQHGWMELGFQTDYFRSALSYTGWRSRETTSQDVPWMTAWELSELEPDSLAFSAGGGKLLTEAGRVERGQIVLDPGRSGYALYGPYTRLPAGAWRAVAYFASGQKRAGIARIDVVDITLGLTYASKDVNLADPSEGRNESEIHLDFELGMPAAALEFRIWVDGGASLTLNMVEFMSLG